MVTLAVHEMKLIPVAPDDEPVFAYGPDDAPIQMPFRQEYARPFTSTISVTPGLKHTERVITRDVDVYFEVTLSMPTGDTVIAEMKFIYVDLAEARGSVAGANIVKVGDPFPVTKTTEILMDTGSAEILQLIKRSGEPPNETVTTTQAIVSARRGLP